MRSGGLSGGVEGMDPRKLDWYSGKLAGDHTLHTLHTFHALQSIKIYDITKVKL